MTSPSSQSPPLPRTTLVAFGMIAGCVIAAQVVVSRLLAATIGYYYGFMIVSLAMLGLGGGGLLVQQLPHVFTRERLETHAGMAALAMAVLGFGGTLLELLIYPYLTTGLRSLALGLMFLCLFPYFLAGGTAVSLVLFHARRAFFRAYAVDLGAAAIGAALSVVLLDRISPSMVFVRVLCVVPAAAAAVFWWGGARTRLARGAIVSLGLIVFGGAGLSWYPRLKDPSHIHWIGRERIAVSWNSFSNVSVYPGAFFTWALSSEYDGPRHPMRDLLIDGIGGTEIVKFDGTPETLASFDYLRHDITALAHELVPPEGRQLIVGPGGGVDILQAKHFGRESVTVVEINPAVVEMVNDEMADWSGSPYRLPGVDVELANGRTFIKRAEDKWRLITLTWVDSGGSRTAMALNENYLYTIESYREFLEHLEDDGYMAFMRSLGLYEPFRVDTMRGVAIAIEALAAMGVEDPKRHLIVGVADSPYYANRPMCFVLVKRTPVTAAESAKARSFLEAMKFHPVWLPDGSVGRDAVPEPYAKHTTVIWDTVNATDREAFYAEAPFDVEPPTDDRPFYFAQRKGKNRPTGAAIRELTDSTSILGLLVLPFLAIPLLGARRKKQPLGSFGVAAVGYFSCLGFAFMLVEIELFHLFSLILGNPTYSLSVVLACLLVSSGVGSLLAERVAGGGRRAVGGAFVALLVLLGLFSLGKDAVTAGLIGQSLTVRILGTIAIIAPLGICMGLPMSMGMTLVADRPDIMMWGWALNGALSVFASVVAMFVAMHVGIAAAFGIGLAAYAVAGLLIQGLIRSPGEDAPAKEAATAA